MKKTLSLLLALACSVHAAEEEKKQVREPNIRDKAFRQLLEQNLPLTPNQLMELRKKQDLSIEAASAPPKTPPRPISSTLNIDLSPGATPPVVRLASGFVSSLVFVDSTGKPWPIANYSLGNPRSFNIQWDQKQNTLFMQSVIKYSSGNLAVRLVDLDTPIMLSIVSDQKEVDYRVDLKVSARGPNAEVYLISNDYAPVTDNDLLNVLDGMAPMNSTELHVVGDYGRAWVQENRLILRTKLKVLSPAWSSTVSSADGTHVYEMSKTPLILAADNGRTVQIQLKGL